MSTYETYEAYESNEGQFEGEDESFEGAFEGAFETGYEMYEGEGEGEDEQFLGDVMRGIGSFVGSQSGEGESPLSESQEMELTAELLEVASEEELEEFLGNLFKGVAKGVGGFIRSPVGKALGGVLKNVAKKALPVVGGALGSMVAPGIGTSIGSQLGSMASGLFEMELEGMSQEQAEFEVARRVVRLGATSAAHAARAPRNVPPARVARVAITQAARQHAPGLLRGTTARAGATATGAQMRPRQRHPQRRVVQHPGVRVRRPGGRAWGMIAYPQRATSYVTPGWGANGGATVQAPSPAGVPGWGGDGGTVQAAAPAWSAPAPAADYGTSGTASYGGRPQSGRWIRRGRKIVLLGV